MIDAVSIADESRRKQCKLSELHLGVVDTISVDGSLRPA